MGKKELYRFSLGFYFYYMGGEPLDRSGGLNKVDSIAAIFQRKETFRLTVLFEGTEKNRCIKNRFLFYALKANFPIIPVTFNFGKKVVNLGKSLMPIGNLEEDRLILNKHFIGVLGKVPEKGFRVSV